jgi:oligopeptide transport system substrate-binding protein
MITLSSRTALGILLLTLSIVIAGCSAAASNSVFFGKTDPPRENVLRYCSGAEPETLDPQIPPLQNEARVAMALFEGLAEYDPKTTAPVPALAERWEVNKDWSEVTFHLRHDGRFSNGDPITAQDFVYTIRRGLRPETASRVASLAYPIKYAQAFNEGGVFVYDPAAKSFLLEKDFAAEAPKQTFLSEQPVESVASEYPPIPEESTPDADTAFHREMHNPVRLVLPGSEKKRNAAIDADPKLKAAVAGKQFVPVKEENVGIEAVNDYTLRIILMTPAPYFISMMPHQFFRALHRKTIERFGDAWTDPAHIVTSGAFKLESWNHYDRIVVGRNPMYWDAASVKLDKIVFFLLSDNTTMMTLYKAGELDATYNHTVPSAWLEVVGSKKDFMDAPEAAIDYYNFNTTKGPTKDLRVRKALNMSIDKKAMADWRHVQPLTAMTPTGIFPGYPQPQGDQFNPQQARKLLADAGYKDASGNFDPKKLETSEIELITNPDGSNVAYAEFVQAQWKQNLGATIQIRVMENKTYFKAQSALDYKGVSRTGFAADYMDPFTFLGIFYAKGGANSTGWADPKYVALLDEANRTIDPHQRYALMAQAEKMLLDEQIVIPLVVPTTREMKKPYVKGMYPNAASLHAWKYVYIERDSANWDYGVPNMN